VVGRQPNAPEDIILRMKLMLILCLEHKEVRRTCIYVYLRAIVDEHLFV